MTDSSPRPVPLSTDCPASSPSGNAGVARAGHAAGSHKAGRLLAALAVPVIVYFAVRPSVGSDAAGLAIAGAVPVSYALALVLVRRRVDLWAVLSSVGFAIGCAASLFANSSALPLKLHEAAVTFVVGVVLLGAVMGGRPLPVGRVLRLPHADRDLDTALSLMVGAFLVLHALLHVALALTLSTSSYLTVGRVVDWATIAAGAVCLYGYVRRVRRDACPESCLAAPRSSDEGRLH